MQYPKKSLCCFRDPKNPGVFHRRKKNAFWPKCQTQKKPSDPPVIKICEWGPWEWQLPSIFIIAYQQVK